MMSITPFQITWALSTRSREARFYSAEWLCPEGLSMPSNALLANLWPHSAPTCHNNAPPTDFLG